MQLFYYAIITETDFIKVVRHVKKTAPIINL